MVETIVDPINDRAVGKNRGEAPAASLEQPLLPTNVEEAFMLPGETGGRKVFRRRRTTDRNGDIFAVFRLELAIGGGDLCAQAVAAGCRIDDLARLRGIHGKAF